MFGADSIELVFGYSPIVWGIALLIASIFTFIAYRMTNPVISGRKRAFLSALRFLAFLAILLMIIEPLFVWVKSDLVQPRLVILFDDSRSMSLSDKFGYRSNAVNLFRESEDFRNLIRKYPTDFFKFSDSLMKIEENTRLEMNGEATALGDALISLRKYESPEKPIGAVIVVSDGQANYGEDPINAAHRSRFPIYSLGVGDPTPPKDVAIKRLTAQNIAYAGQEFPILAGISSFGYEGREVVVQLYSEEGKKSEKRIVLGGRGELIDIEFSVSPDSAGTYTFRVSLPSLDGELTTANNFRSVRVKVLPSKRKILVIAKELNWEYTFFMRALSINQDLVIKKAFIGTMAKTGDVQIPRSLEGLKEYDIVVISGCLKDLASERLGNIFIQYVKYGGALHISLIGDVNLERSEGSIWAQVFPFIYSQGSHVWTSDRFVPELTVSGIVHPATRVSEITISPRDAYQNLPPLSGFAMITGSTQSSVALMSHPRLQDVPIVAVREVGLGRVSMFNGAGFWRWGFLPFGFGGNNKTYISLVSNTISWLLAAGARDKFSVETDKAVYRSGEKIIVSAGLRDDANKPLEGAKVYVAIFDVDTGSIIKDTLNIVLEDRGGGIYTQELPPLSPGNWRISANAELDEQKLAFASGKFLVEEYSIELENVHLDEPFLENISAVSGGEYARIDNFTSVADKIDLKKYPIKRKREKAFWDNPFLLMAFVFLLCAEWVLRKRWDLP